MRNRPFAFDQSFRDHLSHAGQTDARTLPGRDPRGCCRFRWRRAALRFCSRAHIAFRHAAFGTSSFYRRKIEALLGREPPRNRGRLHSRFTPVLWPRRRFCFRLRTFLRRRGLWFFLLARRWLLRLRLLFLFCRSFLFLRFRLRVFFLFFLRRGFSFAADERDLLANLDLPAFFDVNLRQRPVLGRFPFHRRLVGLDLGNHFAGRDLVALLFLPRDESSFRHRVAELRHLDFRHGEKSSGVTNLLNGGDQLLRAGQNRFFELLVVRHRHVFLRNAQNRRVELIENLFLNSIRNFRADAAERPILFDDHHAMRFRNGVQDRIQVERLDRTKVENLGADLFVVLQRFRNGQRERNRLRVTDDRDVAAFSFHLRFAERNEELDVFVLDHSLRAVEQLDFEHEDRIVVADRGLQQSLGVARRGRRADL